MLFYDWDTLDGLGHPNTERKYDAPGQLISTMSGAQTPAPALNTGRGRWINRKRGWTGIGLRLRGVQAGKTGHPKTLIGGRPL
jgi:hypothetical protein